jgi:Protein of unknown function (DUF2934)
MSMAKKQTDDLVDAGSEYSFPASDPPSYMGGAAVVGPPPEDGEPPHEPVVQELTDPDEAKPAEEAPQGSDPARAGVLENPPVAMPSHRAPDSTDTGSPQGETDERIRLRAYEIWEAEGRSGDAYDHWLRAEREIRGEIRTEPDQAAEGRFQPLSEDAAKMREQVNVAMDARNARSKQTKRAGATAKKEAVGTTGPRKGKPRNSK